MSNENWLAKLAALGLAAGMRHWLPTLDAKNTHYDPTTDPSHPENNSPKIYLLWHEYLLYPVFARGNCNISMLVSQHRDADALKYLAKHFGYGLVRGSTARGAVQALRKLMRSGEGGHLAITPDGPRGPRREMAPGPIFLASRLQMPIVLVGVGFDRPWRTRSWDRFAVPRPFSRARTIWSGPIHVPAGLDRAGLEQWRQGVEAMLLRYTTECEAWAESRTRRVGEVPFRPTPHRPLLAHDAHAELAGPHFLARAGRGEQPAVCEHAALDV